MPKKTDEAEAVATHEPTVDHRGHCTVCGGWGDHVHSTQPPKPEPRKPRAPKPDPDEPSEDDDVLVIELEPEMLAAMGEAGEVELDVDIVDGGWDETRFPPEPQPEPEKKSKRARAQRKDTNADH